MSDLYIEARFQSIKDIASTSCTDIKDADNIAGFCDEIYSAIPKLDKIIEELELHSFELGTDTLPVHYVRLNDAIEIVKDVAIQALEKQITRKSDEYVSELLDDEIKCPKISRLEAKAIKVALYHQWFKITDANGNAISCSQEMADATYRMLSLFDELIKESDKDNEIKEKENGYR